MREAAGPEEKPMTEIPLVCYLSFLHSPSEEKRKGCGRFKRWKILFLSVILFRQSGCHIINTRPRTWELLLCTPPPYLHESRTQYPYFFESVLVYPYQICKAALLYQLVENRNNSAGENLDLSRGTAHHWHSLSGMSTACQVWRTLHSLYLERRSPAQKPDYFWSFLHHSKLHSEQKAPPFSLAFFLTLLHFNFL